MELWDAYDIDFNKASGITLVRGKAIPDGLFHLVSEVLVKHTDGTYLIMQRDVRKHLGGLWEATAGGSALKGETPLDCALRELHEETGIRTDNLSELGRVISQTTKTHYFEYLCVTDWDKDKIVLQEGETTAFRWVRKEELLLMRHDELASERLLKYVV